MKKYLILIIILTVSVLPLSAQKSKDVLYLKNGSIIYGKLLEISDNRYRIQTSDGSIFNYQSDEVDKYLKEAPKFEGRKQKGMGFVLEAGFLVGSQNSELDAPFSFNLLANYTLSMQNIIGIGSGVEFLGSTFSPIFVEYKRLINEKKTAPFIFIRGGSLIHTGSNEESDPNNPYYFPKDYKGGASFTLGTGISWAREDTETYLSFAYRYARTSYSQKNYNDVTYTYETNYNRLEVKLGFKF